MRCSCSSSIGILLVLTVCSLLQVNGNEEKSGVIEYGVDVSFPMHHEKVSDNYAWLPHNTDPSNHVIPAPLKGKVIQPMVGRQEFYDKFVQGCVDHFGRQGGQRCVITEKDRISMSLRQPQSMVNYTEVGYKKIKAPEPLFKLISEFWEKNKDKQSTEQWGIGNTYTNNWEVPTSMVSVEDRSLRGGGYSLKQQIWDAAQETLQEWTGQELTQCSLYGIRVYKTNSVLSTHVDRLPLVSSAIINVAADVDEPWPLEVIGHDGRAENVTMEPGDMVLYESHSVLHGRPFPLKGRYVANIFIHFEPTGHTLRHFDGLENEGQDVHAKYREAVQKGISGHESDNSGLPPYLIPGTPEESNWRAQHPQGTTRSQTSSFSTGSTAIHIAVIKGDLRAVQRHVRREKDAINAKDKNGWTPLHEATRGGHTDIVKFLLENGADVNIRANDGLGGSALYLAKRKHGDDHPIIEILESAGALELGPEL